MNIQVNPLVKVTFRGKQRKKYDEELDLWDWEELRGWKAQGKKITSDAIEAVELLDWYEEEETEETDATAEPLEESEEPIKTGHVNTESPPSAASTEETEAAREFEWDLKTDSAKAKPVKKRGKKKGGGGSGQMGLF